MRLFYSRFLFYLALSLYCLNADSKIYYVAKTGSNSNAGSSTAPFKTIPYGYSKLNPGDTLIVRAGVYTEYRSGYGILLNRSGTASLPITIKSEVRGAAVIDLQNKTDSNHVLWISKSYNVIDGFKIRNGYNGGISIYGSYNKIIRNEIYNNGNAGDPKSSYGHDGIFSASTTVGNLYDSNYIHHNGRIKYNSNLDHGLYLCGDNEVVMNNIVTYNSAYGIQIAGYDTVANMKVYNNVFGFNGRSGGMLWKTVSSVIFRNNIFYKNKLYAVDTYAAKGSGVLIDRNISYGNTYGHYRMNAASSTVSYSYGTNFTSNPLFISEVNYRLQSLSPAINRGTSLTSVVKTDYLGIARPRGGAFDIGSYER